MTDFVCASTDLEGGLALPGVVSCSVFGCASTELVPQGSISGTSINAMADAVWAKFLSAESFTAGMAGDFIKSRIDAAISSRATTAEVAAVEAKVDLIPTALVDLSGLDGKLDTIDGVVDGLAVSIAAIPTTPVDLSGINTKLDTIDTVVDGIDVKVDAIESATPAEIADAVWDEGQTDHTVEETFGIYLDDKVSGAQQPVEFHPNPPPDPSLLKLWERITPGFTHIRGVFYSQNQTFYATINEMTKLDPYLGSHVLIS